MLYDDPLQKWFFNKSLRETKQLVLTDIWQRNKDSCTKKVNTGSSHFLWKYFQTYWFSWKVNSQNSFFVFSRITIHLNVLTNTSILGMNVDRQTCQMISKVAKELWLLGALEERHFHFHLMRDIQLERWVLDMISKSIDFT